MIHVKWSWCTHNTNGFPKHLLALSCLSFRVWFTEYSASIVWTCAVAPLDDSLELCWCYHIARGSWFCIDAFPLNDWLIYQYWLPRKHSLRMNLYIEGPGSSINMGNFVVSWCEYIRYSVPPNSWFSTKLVFFCMARNTNGEITPPLLSGRSSALIKVIPPISRVKFPKLLLLIAVRCSPSSRWQELCSCSREPRIHHGWDRCW